ncbi:MAG TPA: CDP-glucose 4,6-dehydratase [Coriobacteriia bacterium]
MTRPVTAWAELFGGAYDGRKVFVTGHTGFKGSWLVRWLLLLGAEVTGYALDPPTDPSLFEDLGLARRMRHIVADVRDGGRLRAEMAAAAPDIVFHLAAQPLVRLSYDEPVATYETNVLGTVNLLEAVRATPSARAVVNVTSDKCYENRETGQAYREDDAMGGFDPYSSSKGCAELVTSAYRRSFFGEGSDVRLASVRAGNVVGGGDWAFDRIVPDCIRALMAGEPIVVRNPDAVRPWQHVLEPLSGYLHLGSLMLAGGHEHDGAWNFGPEDAGTVRVRQVVDAVVDGWGSGSWVTPEGAPKQPHEATLLALDITKAKEQLGWRPVYGVDATLWATTAWYRVRHASADAADERTVADIEEYVSAALIAGAPWAGTPPEGND